MRSLKNLKLVLIMALITALLFLATACTGSEPKPEPKPSLEPGTPAPEFSLSTLAGDKCTVPKDFENRAVLMMFSSLG